MNAFFRFIIGLGYILSVTCAHVEEPRACYNRFEYEYKVLEQLLELRKDLDKEKVTNTKLTVQIEDAREKVEDMKNKLSRAQRSFDGSTYTRWGRKVCPKDATLVYEGFVAAGHYTHSGAGVNYLCLPNDPLWDQYTDDFQTADRIYGTEYHTSDYSDWKHIHGHDVPCVMCRIPRNDVLMIPGRNQCYDDYKLEYSGYLMAEHYSHSASTEYVCVDGNPETITGGHEYKGESFLFFVQATCGLITCPPYATGRELTCAVCSFSPNTSK